jgi:hypothetical protein
MAAALAADHIATKFSDTGPLEIEAVEEPSSIAGVPASELSYVGIEPWIALLRNAEREIRYIVVIQSDGSVIGDLSFPMLQWDKLYLFPSDFSSS